MSGNTFYSTCSAKFKHHKYFENVNFEETSNIVSILVIKKGKNHIYKGVIASRNKTEKTFSL